MLNWIKYVFNLIKQSQTVKNSVRLNQSGPTKVRLDQTWF